MRRLASRLGFVHRTLWRRDAVYRWAVLLGPPPLLGAATAALALALLHANGPRPSPAGEQVSDAPWATWERPVPQQTQPFDEPLAAAVPPSDGAGGLAGFRTGWAGAILRATIDATQDVNVSPSALAGFTLDQPAVTLDRIVEAGPPTGLFVGAVRTLFVARMAGVYAFTVRLRRASRVSADCLVRFGAARHKLVRALDVGLAGDAERSFPAAEFRLQPGLLPLAVATGCWRGGQMEGGGDVTVLVRAPGETALRSTTADELVWPVSPRPSAGAPVTH